MTNVLYQDVPTTIAANSEKTILGDNVGRPRVVVDSLPPPTPSAPIGQLRFSTSWAPLDYPTLPIVVPAPNIAQAGYLEYVSIRTDPNLDTTKDWYVLVLDQATVPVGGEVALETFGPLVNDDFDYWEPEGAWLLGTGLYLAVSSTPVTYTAPVAPAATDQFAYTIKFTPF